MTTTEITVSQQIRDLTEQELNVVAGGSESTGNGYSIEMESYQSQPQPLTTQQIVHLFFPNG